MVEREGEREAISKKRKWKEVRIREEKVRVKGEEK